MDLKLLEQLGLTKAQIEEKIVQKISNDILYSQGFDEDGDSFEENSQFKRQLETHVQKRLATMFEALADKIVKPSFEEQIEALCFQKTNNWGEKTGEKLTFREWLEKQFDVYMQTPVNYDGKSQSEAGSWGSSWNKTGTRISYMVDKHLQYTIETAVKGAMKTANDSIAEGLKKAVQIKIDEIAAQLKVDVKTK